MWFIYALATSICAAVYYICNQNCKLSPHLFIIYRGFIPALIILPITLFLSPNFEWPFFLIAILQGFGVSYLDYHIYKLFQKYGAESVASVQPLSVLITFVFWLLIRPSLLVTYMENMWHFALIVLAVLCIVYAVMKYRQQPFVLSCLRDMIPLLLIFSLIDVTNKLIMEYTNNHLLAATIYRVLIVSAMVGFVNLGVGFRCGIKASDLFKKENISATWFFLFIPISMMLINFSAFHADNPAYASAVIYMSVIWILLFNKILQYFGFSTKGDPIAKRWIVLLVVATMLLIILTA